MSDDEHDDDDWDDESEPDFDGNPDRDGDGCCLGSECLNPHPYHLAAECFDLEMARALMGDDDAEASP